jgi:hypothetical protein
VQRGRRTSGPVFITRKSLGEAAPAVGGGIGGAGERAASKNANLSARNGDPYSIVKYLRATLADRVHLTLGVARQSASVVLLSVPIRRGIGNRAHNKVRIEAHQYTLEKQPVPFQPVPATPAGRQQPKMGATDTMGPPSGQKSPRFIGRSHDNRKPPATIRTSPRRLQKETSPMGAGRRFVRRR